MSTDDETDSGTGPTTDMTTELTRPQPHLGCVALDGSVGEGEWWRLTGGRGEELKYLKHKVLY